MSALSTSKGKMLKPRDDHVALAVGDVEVAVGIAPPNIAGVQPAEFLDLGRGNLVVEITVHLGRPPHHDFALLIGAENAAVLVHDLKRLDDVGLRVRPPGA
jgi:hypothetical protein